MMVKAGLRCVQCYALKAECRCEQKDWAFAWPACSVESDFPGLLLPTLLTPGTPPTIFLSPLVWTAATMQADDVHLAQDSFWEWSPTAQGVKQAHRPTSAPVQYRPEVSPPPNPEPVIVANQCTVRLRPAAPVWQSHRPCLVLPAGGHSYISSDPSSGTGSGTFCWSRSYAKPRRSRRAPVSKPKRKTLEKARSAHHRTHRGCCHVLHISDALWTLLNDSL